MIFGPGGGENTRGHETSPNITRTVTNDGRPISEEFLNGHEFIKMCILCILFLLAVNRLVLIVNSLGCCWGGVGQVREVRSSPYYWNSVLLRPDESFLPCFCFICIFPELEDSKGECFANVGQEASRTKSKITFPFEKKNKVKKKINAWFLSSNTDNRLL